MVNTHRVIEVDPVAIGKLSCIASISTVRKATDSGLLPLSKCFLMLFLKLRHELLCEIFEASSRNHNEANHEALDAEDHA